MHRNSNSSATSSEILVQIS